MIPDSRPAFQQTTLRTAFSVSGTGMHTGATARVIVSPSPAGSGIEFVCGTCRDALRLPARAAFVVSTRRCTCLGIGDTRLDTVEHLLSALYGLQVDNAEIRVEGPEMPILDGSALPWTEAIQSAGITTLPQVDRPVCLSAPIALQQGETWLVATPADRFTLTCATHFDHPLLGTQVATFVADPAVYAAQIAPARTFGFAHEIDALRAEGLARGGSLDNALIIYDDRFSDNLRVPEECLRHKVLDLWGDLALVGRRLCAAITAIKPGHRANVAFAALLADTASTSIKC